MKPGVSLLSLGSILIFAITQTGPAGILLLWLGGDFLLLGAAHFRGAHGLFGKRSDGTLPIWSWVIFLPLMVFSGVVWHLARVLSREAPFHSVSSDLVVGRRLLAGEAPGKFANYVDLTAEFAEPKPYRDGTGYLALPVLDGAAPSPERLRAAVARLGPGRTYIHCAQGHGRTGMFALAVLLLTGEIRTVEEGQELLSRVRPGIRLSPSQMACVRTLAANC